MSSANQIVLTPKNAQLIVVFCELSQQSEVKSRLGSYFSSIYLVIRNSYGNAVNPAITTISESLN